MGDQLLCAFVSEFSISTFVESLVERTHVEGFEVKRWGGEEGAWWRVWWGGGNCDERERGKVLKMGWRSTRVTMVNILSWTLMNTFMVLSVRARQDQTPSYEELGEMEKIFQHFFF